MVTVDVMVPALDFSDMTTWLKEFAPGARYSNPKFKTRNATPTFCSTVTFPDANRAILFKLTWYKVL